jgi:hypothetical protein
MFTIPSNYLVFCGVQSGAKCYAMGVGSSGAGLSASFVGFASW